MASPVRSMPLGFGSLEIANSQLESKYFQTYPHYSDHLKRMVALIRHLSHIIGEASLKQANALKLILSGASVLVIETKTASSITGLVLDDFFKTSFSKREDLSPKGNKDLQQKLPLAARQLELAVK